MNDLSNWADGVINGLWGQSLIVRGAQYIDTSRDTSFLNGITIEHGTASGDIYLRGSGARRTLTLNGNITNKVNRSFWIGNQGTENQSLNLDLGGVPRTFSIETGTIRIRNAMQNMDSLLITGGGTLYFDGNDMSQPNAEITIDNRTSVEFNSDRGNGAVRADTIALRTAFLRASGNGTANSTNRIESLVIDTNKKGGINSFLLYPKANRETVFSIGEITRQNFSPTRIAVGGNDAVLGNAPASNVGNVFIDNPPELFGDANGLPGTPSVQIIPWMYTDGNSLVLTYDTEKGVRPLDLVTEFRTYANGYNGPVLGNVENVYMPSGTAVTFTEEGVVNSIMSAYLASVSNITSTNKLHVKSGLVMLRSNASMSINAPLDFTGVQGVIASWRGKGSTITRGISGDCGIVFYQMTTELPVTGSSGSSVGISGSDHTVTGDIYLFGRIDLGANCNVLPYGDREGDIYNYGRIETHSGAYHVNTMFGGGTLFLLRSSVFTIGHRDSNSIFDGIIADNGGIAKTGAGVFTLRGDESTYTLKTYIYNGILEAYVLNRVVNPRSSSSLGRPVTVANGTIEIGSSTTTGTLRYLGSGESTDRVINLAGTTGGATLDASGSGAVVFESNFTVTVNGAKTLTLAGTNTLGNAVLGVIPNRIDKSTVYPTSLLKTGTGIWMLGGVNTYTGDTTIEEGTLLLTTNGVVISAVTVAPQAFIGGSGNVKNSVMLDNEAGFAASLIAPLIVDNAFNAVGTVNVTLLDDIPEEITRCHLLTASNITGDYLLPPELHAKWHIAKVKNNTEIWLSKNSGSLFLIR